MELKFVALLALRFFITSLSPDGTLLATGSWDSSARLIRTADGSEVARIEHDDAVLAVAFSPDGTLLATGSFLDKGRTARG